MNRLSEETNPYLLQHKDNPVDWYPWGEEALNASKEKNMPILLSIGYSTCHWCHVMAHESFEDAATAEIMNRHFVNIKVDREERPDIDAIYMQAVTSLTGHGGWPMTVFLTPQCKPFYAGTYFPKESRENLPSFKEVLEAVSRSWNEDQTNLTERAEQITEALEASQNLKSAENQQHDAKTQRLEAVRRIGYAQDPAWGGFGNAPKFPQTMVLEYLMAHIADDDIATTIKTSLDAMASGGLYDHLGGGFSRYSTDMFWLVPHFEKMLYDNALLTRLYTLAYLLTKKPRYLQVVEECIEYLHRDLCDQKTGAFYSAEDADSEGKEGTFYVWGQDEFEKTISSRLLDADEATEGEPHIIELAKNWYGISEKGNFEGKNVLYRRHRGDLLRPPEIEQAREALFLEREKRIRPSRDEKVLTEWNALMITSLCDAHFYLERDDWFSYAQNACEFLYENLRRPDGRWMRSWSNADKSASRHLACAADYSQVVRAFMSFYSISGKTVWLDRSLETADGMLELFWDETEGGFFTTGRDVTDTIFNPKDFTDTSVPSANSTGAISLMLLSAYTGVESYKDYANKILDSTALIAYRNPLAFGNFLSALLIREIGIVQIVIPGESEAKPYLDVLKKYYLPNMALAWGETANSPIWEGKQAKSAYICRDFTCREPAHSVEIFTQQLEELSSQTALLLGK